jgi:hypothetical protein
MLLQKYDVVTDEILHKVASNGTLIIEMLKNHTYESECSLCFCQKLGFKQCETPQFMGNVNDDLKLEPDELCQGTPPWSLEI